MQFSNNFTVRAPIEDVWTFLVDASEVTPCVPGATLTESLDATHHKGTVKVKLGAVQMSYRGELEMLPDEAARTIELKARGTETRGGGGASGEFHMKLRTTDDGGTAVEIETKVDVTGKIAQFGRGIMQDVAGRMIKDFANCLEGKLAARQQVAASTIGDSAGPVRPTEATDSSAQADEPAAPTEVPTPAPQPSAVSTPTSSWDAADSSNEIRLLPLLGDLMRSQTARALRALAAKIEPR